MLSYIKFLPSKSLDRKLKLSKNFCISEWFECVQSFIKPRFVHSGAISERTTTMLKFVGLLYLFSEPDSVGRFIRSGKVLVCSEA